MKKLILICILFVLSISINAQPTVTKAGNFSAGDVFLFQNCLTNNVGAGTIGANQTWDFSNLQPIAGDTLFDWILLPSQTPFDTLFPTANLVEKYSDASWLFLNKTATDNNMVGYIDDNNAITMFFDNSKTIGHRPLNASSNLNDNFAEHFTYNTYDLVGTGVSNISSEGWGTLILPNGTHNNVLKVHISQVQVDTVIQFGSEVTTTWNTWVWLDTIHTAPLLKIDSLENIQFSSKSVYYFLSETLTGIQNEVATQNGFDFYPNPAHHAITLTNLDQGIVIITNQSGQIVTSIDVAKNEKTKTLTTDKLCKGAYFISFVTKNMHSTKKLLIE